MFTTSFNKFYLYNIFVEFFSFSEQYYFQQYHEKPNVCNVDVVYFLEFNFFSQWYWNEFSTVYRLTAF